VKRNLITGLPSQIIAQIEQAAEIIRSGGVVAFPTDTVYGLGADIYNEESVRRVFLIKKRPHTMPVPVLIARTEDARLLAEIDSEIAQKLMKSFWPGGLTIIFRSLLSLSSPVTGGTKKIGIRLPAHDITRLLILMSGTPITGTSANLHNREIALSAQEVKEQLGNSVDFIIDGGRSPRSIESTIIDITVDPPAIIRYGIISKQEIEQIIQPYKGIAE
jgi:L-threonylcarbamoyladenylate synthase